MTEPLILVTGFEPFGGYTVNPTEELAKAIDGRRIGAARVRGLILPVHHREACATMNELLGESPPAAVLHLGLAEGRARIALERIAVNVMDYSVPDNAGYRAAGEACVPGGPLAHASTLPLPAMLAAITTEGIPAYLSQTAGTYLCNQTLYGTLHTIAARALPTRAGFIHVPLLPSMVAVSGRDEPSMDAALTLRALEIALIVIAGS